MTEERQQGAEAEAVAPAEAPVEAVGAAEPAEEKEKTRKRPRARMTLRIPDDGVSRPGTPTDGVTAGRGSVPDEDPLAETEENRAPSIVPTPIINVGTPSSPAPPLDDIPTPIAPPVFPVRPASNPDESWTPYQPTIADSAPKDAELGSDPDSI